MVGIIKDKVMVFANKTNTWKKVYEDLKKENRVCDGDENNSKPITFIVENNGKMVGVEFAECTSSNEKATLFNVPEGVKPVLENGVVIGKSGDTAQKVFFFEVRDNTKNVEVKTYPVVFEKSTGTNQKISYKKTVTLQMVKYKI